MFPYERRNHKREGNPELAAKHGDAVTRVFIVGHVFAGAGFSNVRAFGIDRFGSCLFHGLVMCLMPLVFVVIVHDIRSAVNARGLRVPVAENDHVILPL
jgi:hypothetical protein